MLTFVPMNYKIPLFLLGLLIGGAPALFGQVSSPQDTVPRSGNLPVDRMDQFQLVFTRGFLLGPTNEDPQIPIHTGNSGSLFLGAGIKFNLAKNVLGIRITPGFNWFKLNYQQEEGKLFPSDSTQFDFEKHRITYVELPVGLYVNLSKDEDGDSKVFVEGGGFLGYKLNGIYKFQYQRQGRTIKERWSDVANLEDWRYGLYFRLGYKRWATYFSYLLSDPFTRYQPEGQSEALESVDFPPRLEAGVSFFL